MIFESHAHYDDAQFDDDRELLLKQLPQEGIGYVVNIGADVESTKASMDLAEAYPYIYAAAGVHPSSVKDLKAEDYAWLEAAVRENVKAKGRIVAIGEIGLDYYWDKDQAVRDLQKQWFRRQMDLAREVKLPVVIHSRDAAMDTYTMMADMKAQEIGGVIHCYSNSVEMARDYLNMGLYLGIGGVLTFANAKTLKEVVKYAPIDRLLLETDCPYLAPVPNRGKRNSSLNLHFVAEAIAAIKGLETQQVIEQTCINAKTMYGID